MTARNRSRIASRRAALATGLGLLAAVGMAASVYEVQITPELNGLDIGIETVEQPDMLVVKLTNRTAQKVRCRLRYDAQPQSLVRQTLFVAPGATEQGVLRATRRWYDVEVTVECEPDSK